MSGRQPKGHRKATITEARKVCEEHGARQVIVLLFDGSEVSGVSYGTTKTECASVGRTLDAIIDRLMHGDIPAPEAQTTLAHHTAATHPGSR